MARMIFVKSSPAAAYECAEIEGGETMKPHEKAALLDDFVAEHGLIPVESTFDGDVPSHRYGRYLSEEDAAVADGAKRRGRKPASPADNASGETA